MTEEVFKASPCTMQCISKMLQQNVATSNIKCVLLGFVDLPAPFGMSRFLTSPHPIVAILSKQ